MPKIFTDFEASGVDEACIGFFTRGRAEFVFKVFLPPSRSSVHGDEVVIPENLAEPLCLEVARRGDWKKTDQIIDRRFPLCVEEVENGLRNSGTEEDWGSEDESKLGEI